MAKAPVSRGFFFTPVLLESRGASFAQPPAQGPIHPSCGQDASTRIDWSSQQIPPNDIDGGARGLQSCWPLALLSVGDPTTSQIVRTHFNSD